MQQEMQEEREREVVEAIERPMEDEVRAMPRDVVTGPFRPTKTTSMLRPERKL